MYLTNKSDKKVTVRVKFESLTGNIRCPRSFVKEYFIDKDTKCVLHLMKIDPTKEWGNLDIKVETKEKVPIPNAPHI